MAEFRKFETGATRDSDINKYDYEGFFSPLVMERIAAYMHKHRVQVDGSTRASDNWQKGIPLDAYVKSGFRHFVDWWKEHRGHPSPDGLEEAICALIFNASGYLHEVLKDRPRKERNEKDICFEPGSAVSSYLKLHPMPVQRRKTVENFTCK